MGLSYSCDVGMAISVGDAIERFIQILLDCHIFLDASCSIGSLPHVAKETELAAFGRNARAVFLVNSVAEVDPVAECWLLTVDRDGLLFYSFAPSRDPVSVLFALVLCAATAELSGKSVDNESSLAIGNEVSPSDIRAFLRQKSLVEFAHVGRGRCDLWNQDVAD